MDIALYQPDIPQNTGAVIRTTACLGAGVHIIEPCGFPFSDKGLRRAGMDYVENAKLKRHASWEEFESWRADKNRRLILLTTRSEKNYTDFNFRLNDILLLGRESAGVPGEVFEGVDETVLIPMKSGFRSLNVAVAGAIVLAEALRQTGQL